MRCATACQQGAVLLTTAAQHWPSISAFVTVTGARVRGCSFFGGLPQPEIVAAELGPGPTLCPAQHAGQERVHIERTLVYHELLLVLMAVPLAVVFIVHVRV
jgi:hypothetical protein